MACIIAVGLGPVCPVAAASSFGKPGCCGDGGGGGGGGPPRAGAPLLLDVELDRWPPKPSGGDVGYGLPLVAAPVGPLRVFVLLFDGWEFVSGVMFVPAPPLRLFGPVVAGVWS